MCKVFIQAQGHGIRPLKKKDHDGRNMLIYKRFSLIPFDKYTDNEWKAIKKIIVDSGINFPDMQFDTGMHLALHRDRRNIHHNAGDLVYYPNKVFKAAERKYRI